MTWTYKQATGELQRDGVFEGTGYSGHSSGRNNYQMENVPRVGPIPAGAYKIGPAYHHDHLGPCVMNVDAEAGTDTLGRSLFRIHGDNVNHVAAEGCIILGPSIRQLIAASGDHELRVIH